MGSLSVWGDVWSFAVMEYDQSCDLGIFRSWWPKVMSPYTPFFGVYSLYKLRIRNNFKQERETEIKDKTYFLVLATGRTAFPCPWQAVLVNMPGEIYTG